MPKYDFYKAISLYNKKEIAVGYKIELMNFLTKIRPLKKNIDFELIQLDLSLSEIDNIEILYPTTHMVPYLSDTITIPKIVMDIIEMDINSAMRNLAVTRSQMIEFIYYGTQSKRIKGEMPTVIKSTKLIDNILENKELMKNYRKSIYRNHPILYCDEVEYWRYINQRNESSILTEDYLTKLRDIRS